MNEIANRGHQLWIRALIAWYFVWLAVALWMVNTVPVIAPFERETFDIDPGHRRALSSGAPVAWSTSGNDSHRHSIEVDLQTGAIKKHRSPNIARAFDISKLASQNGTESCFDLFGVDETQKDTFSGTWVFQKIDPETLETIDEFQHSFDQASRSVMQVGNRYFLFQRERSLAIVDAESHKVREFSTAIDWRGSSASLSDMPYYLVWDISEIEEEEKKAVVYQITDSLQIEKAFAGIQSNRSRGGIGIAENMVVLISSDCKRVEFRSLDDGELVESVAIPANFRPLIRAYGTESSSVPYVLHVPAFDRFEIAAPQRNIYFDVRNRQWKQSPVAGDCRLIAHCEDQPRYLYVDSDDRRVVASDGSGEHFELTDYLEFNSSVHFYDSETVVASTVNGGFQFDFYRWSDGKIIRTIRLYAWVVPLAFCLVLLHAVWSVLWVKSSTKRDGSVLLDWCMIMLPVMATLLMRIAFRDELSPPKLECTVLLLVAGSFASSLIVCLHKEKYRWSTRAVAAFGIVISLAWVISTITYVRVDCEPAFVSAFAIILTELTIALLRWKKRKKEGLDSTESRQSWRQVTIRDATLVTMIAASVFATYRAGWFAGNFDSVESSFIFGFAATACAGLGAWSAKRLRGKSVLVQMVCLVGLVSIASLVPVHSHYPIWLGFPPDILTFLSMISVAICVGWLGGMPIRSLGRHLAVER